MSYTKPQSHEDFSAVSRNICNHGLLSAAQPQPRMSVHHEGHEEDFFTTEVAETRRRVWDERNFCNVARSKFLFRACLKSPKKAGRVNEDTP